MRKTFVERLSSSVAPLHAEPAASLKSPGFFVTLLEGG
jgi:hypothetical protein